MDPTGGIGAAAKELMAEMQKANAEMQQMQEQSQTQGADGGKFDQAMQAQQTQGAENATQVDAGQRVQETQKSSNILQQAKVDSLTPSTRVGATAKAENSKAADMLQGLLNGQNKMQKVMNMALSGRQMSPQELLAMQADIYRFTQEMELTGKVVEKGTGGLKQVMNTQV